MKLSQTTIANLRQILNEAAFNANNITIVDDITENHQWTIIFGTETGCAELVLSVEDADYLIEKHFNDGLAYGYEYILQISTDIRMRHQIDELLAFIKGWVFMAVRTAPIEATLTAIELSRKEVA